MQIYTSSIQSALRCLASLKERMFFSARAGRFGPAAAPPRSDRCRSLPGGAVGHFLAVRSVSFATNHNNAVAARWLPYGALAALRRPRVPSRHRRLRRRCRRRCWRVLFACCPTAPTHQRRRCRRESPSFRLHVFFRQCVE